ncbi:hypothetical protein A2U01_0108407, partial [Trifolium medium]|nr:hypothetical protein [Trifolium medium]
MDFGGVVKIYGDDNFLRDVMVQTVLAVVVLYLLLDGTRSISRA